MLFLQVLRGTVRIGSKDGSGETTGAAEMKLTVEMPWERDLSVNHIRYGAGGGYRKKPHVQAWMQRLTAEFYVDRMRLWELEGITILTCDPVPIVVDFRFPDNRKRDDHNYYKVICDSVAVGLGIDDNDIRIRTGTVEVDRDRPGFTITVED